MLITTRQRKDANPADYLCRSSSSVSSQLPQLPSLRSLALRHLLLLVRIPFSPTQSVRLLTHGPSDMSPAYSGSHPSPKFSTMLRAVCGKLHRPAYIAPAWMGQSTELRALNTLPTIPADIDAISPSETPPKPADPKLDHGGVASASTETDAEARTHLRTDSNVTQELNALISVEDQAYMTLRERIDFIILFIVFGALVGACVLVTSSPCIANADELRTASVNAFALLSNEILHPYGYSEDTAGFMVRQFKSRRSSDPTNAR